MRKLHLQRKTVRQSGNLDGKGTGKVVSPVATRNAPATPIGAPKKIQPVRRVLVPDRNESVGAIAAHPQVDAVVHAQRARPKVLDTERARDLSFVIFLPFCRLDFDAAERLIRFHVELGGDKIPYLVLLPDRLPDRDVLALSEIAKQGADHVVVHQQEPFIGRKRWPLGPNLAFVSAAIEAERIGAKAWMFLEADCLPLRRNWWRDIKDEYLRVGKPFLGPLIACKPPLPLFVMNGVAVYPGKLQHHLIHKIKSDPKKPFDIALSEELQAELAHTNLIQFALGPDRTQIEWNSLSQVKPGAVLVHGDKKGQLYRLLSSSPQVAVPENQSSPKLDVAISEIVGASTWPITKPDCDTFWHSGDLGDIIYALPLIKALGGGHLVLGPSPHKNHFRTREPLSRARFDFIRPLLEAQPYIRSVSFSEKQPETCVDLNQFRNLIYSSQFEAHRSNRLSSLVLEWFKAPSWLDDEPWLTCETVPDSPPVVFARSLRYRSKAFDWKAIHQKYGEMAVFVGLPEEHADFVAQVGPVPFRRVADAREMAQLIASSALVVSNQTFALSVAVGLQRPVIVEYSSGTPNCYFNYRGFQYGTGCNLPDIEPPAKVEWRALYDANSGIGRWAYNIARRLHRVRVNWIPTRSDETIVEHPWKARAVATEGCQRIVFDALDAVTSRVADNDIVITIWEKDKLPAESVFALNRAKCVIVPSKFCYDAFRRSGLTVPIHLATLGIDQDVFNPVGRPQRSGPLRFGYAARWSKPCLQRKMPDKVINAFLQVVPNESIAILELKGYGDAPPNVPDDTRIRLINKYLPENELAEWYRSLDYIIDIATGGWELHVHEAMACGAVPIVLDGGGVTEFTDTGCAIIVRSRPEVADTTFHQGDGNWYVPDESSLVEAIKVATEMPEQRRQCMSKCAIANASRYTWDRAADWIERIILSYA